MTSETSRSQHAAEILVAIAIVVAVAAVAWYLVSSGQGGYEHRHTCLICRLDRIDTHRRGEAVASRYDGNACSEWYPLHVEPDHLHIWVANPSFVILNKRGEPMGAGDNENRPGRAVWRLSPGEQQALYQHAADADEVKKILLSFRDTNVMRDRRDFAIVESLRIWMEGGFCGEWQPPALP